MSSLYEMSRIEWWWSQSVLRHPLNAWNGDGKACNLLSKIKN